MPAGTVKYDQSVCASSHRFGDLCQVQGHGFGVGFRHDQSCGFGALWANGPKYVRPFVARVTGRARAGAPFGPNAGQGALLPHARFVLKPDFQGLVFRRLGQGLCYRLGKVFLKVSWADTSDFGW